MKAHAAAARRTAEPCNYRMAEHALREDFGIRDQDTALPNPVPHRHEYFQIHVQLQGQTRHFIGGTCRPVLPGTVCFVLPFKTDFIPTVAGSRYCILNASLGYLLPALDIDMLELEYMPIERAPELAPFRFQEQLDFVLSDEHMARVRVLCEAMAAEDWQRAPGSTIMVRGSLLQLIALVWREYGTPLSLPDAATAAHLSPSYLAHLIKRETGKTFVELLTTRRLAPTPRTRSLQVAATRDFVPALWRTCCETTKTQRCGRLPFQSRKTSMSTPSG